MKCPACPVVGAACGTEADPALGFLCGLAAQGGPWTRHVAERSRIAREGPAPAIAPADPAKLAEVAARRAELAILRSCPNLFTACGCAWGRCLAGRGNASAEVGPDDCRECVATSEAWRAWSI